MIGFKSFMFAQTTIYVNSSTGNDAGGGTVGSPYKTFTKGYAMSNPGDILDLTGTFTWTDADETGDATTSGFTVAKNITILGHVGQTIIQAASSSGSANCRVFTVNSAYSVTFNNLEIRYGNPPNPGDGGGMYFEGSPTITISNCYIHHNTSRQGVGVYISPATVSITNSTIANNTGTNAQTGVNGGGICVQGNLPVTITNTTICNNYIYGYGGGINTLASNTTTITNCVIVSNTSQDDGGGISMGGPSGCAIQIKNTIVANNTSNTVPSTADFDYFQGTLTSNGYNIVEVGTGTFTATGDITSNQANLFGTGIGTTPSLDLNSTLNGTPTLALSAGSIAINAGSSVANGSVSIPTTDQRGLSRVGATDIGAYEYGAVPPSSVPTVTTQAVSSIGTTTATGNGNINDLGSPNPTAHGVCWNTTGTPTVSNSKVDNGAASATGAFTASMTSLSANTTYYVRAYATNTAGTSYGSEVTFTTGGIAPTVSTQAVSSIATTTATGNGNITNLGVPNPTQYGVVWSTSTNPTVALTTKTAQGAIAATGAFTSSITGLSAYTTYYVKAYATNTAGTSYGSEVSFTTQPMIPMVTTQAVSSIATTTATGNGNITILGVPNPTQYGVVWSTSTNPTVALTTKTAQGAIAATGAFTSSIAGLTANTTYYVKAYATNTAGTSYGTEVSFTTLAIAPTVTTQAVSSITSTTAIGNGDITNLGVPNPTAYGVCWNTSGTPTTTDSKIDKGPASAIGAFTASMGSLTANTTYFLRTFATNTAGTSYGNEVTFTTHDITSVSFTSTSQSSVGESGTLTITVQLSEISASDVIVPFTINGSSTATGSGTDFSITASPIVITAGNTTNTITITIASDAMDEYDETVVVDMGTPTNATQGATTTHTATITDDDAAPTVTFTAPSQSSANETGTMTIIAQLSAASGKNITVPFTVNGLSTATGSSTDYSITASPIIITTGNLSNNIIITIASDAIDENNETVIVDMGTPTNATQGATTSHTATITDDDAAPSVTFTAASQSSTDETGIMTITAQLSTISGIDVTVPFTMNGSSTATGSGNDYTITASPITITAGNTTGTITITIAADALDENDETVIVDMGTPTNANQGVTLTHTATITDDDETPVVTFSQSFNVNENSILGTVVGTVVATDPDAGTTFSDWTITVNANADGDGTNAFDIDPSTGQITVTDADDLDREADASLIIKVTVSDGANTSAEENVTINLNDVNDVVPMITASQEFHVTEQSPNGTSVGTVLATDEDVTTTTFQNWTITEGNSDGYFIINSSTGIITVVDNTGLNPVINPTFTLKLTVSDGTNTCLAETISIVVDGINDDNPVITASQSFSIDENSENSTAVGQVLATDPDYGTVFQDWEITAGNTSNAFAINISGELTVNTSSVIDFESVTSFSLTIEVSDGLHSGSGVVTINLNNLNDNTPMITGGTFSIDENSANGTVVCDVNATDADGSLNDLVYSITLGNTNDAFAINSSNGEITVNTTEELDFETTPVFNLTVQVSDGLNVDEANITINLNDLVETGIEENESLEINLYPNPANDKLNILFNHNPSEQFIIEIVSIDGIKVYQGEINNSTTKTIDLTEIPLGLYFIKIFNQNENFTKKLVVQ